MANQVGGKAPESGSDIYRIVGPGSLWFNGKQFGCGDLLELSAAEAAKMGALVARGDATPKQPSAGRRQAGRYRVVGPGSVFSSGKFHGVGKLVELDQNDARSLGSSIEQA